ncbi:hypothetical protein CTI12_AA282160 [Artemisia annua]|uniref:Uncharacterized protein n=1 Tax=Artemisia annua TaxID=35608 RepID=A0A2U1ND41_ARTAN|nr:hypothetical protein CTI12_AA282160 [Artemisia annua]
MKAFLPPTYWIIPVRHEAADAESAPMPLAMPCLIGGGGSVARHEHRAKGRLSNSSELPHLTTTYGQKGECCEGGLIIYNSLY